MKLNQEKIIKKQLNYTKAFERELKLSKFKKYMKYLLLGCLPIGVIFYTINSQGVIDALRIDKRYIAYQKRMEEKNGINLKENEEKIKQFERKWEVNKAVEFYSHRLMYGNKEMNQRVEENKDKNTENTEDSSIASMNVIELQTNPAKNEDPIQMSSSVSFDPRLNKFK